MNALKEEKNLENKNITIVGNGNSLNRKSSAADKYMFTFPTHTIQKYH